MLRAAFDIGGTFTDFVLIDDASGQARTGKVPTVPGQPSDGVLEGLDRMVGSLDTLGFAVHGTTVGLNAFLQRKGGRILLLTTSGHRDTYHIARGHRHTMYDVKYRKPTPLVPLSDIVPITGRLAYDGEEIVPLSTDDVRAAARRAGEEGFDAVVVAFLFSYVNPQHELAALEVLKEELPETPISLSHIVAPEWQEYERTSSAVMDAYVGGPVRAYLGQLRERVGDRGLRQPLHIMQSNGGILTTHGAAERPLSTLLSGPVGGVMGAVALADSLGHRNLICADMGGTSFDVSLVVDGRPDVSPELDLEGLPVLMPAVLIHTIGAGGGSIGYAEAGGLRVGPESAGAQPGPAAYGRGGTQATVTDANLVLGRVSASNFLGGDMRLDAEAAERALEELGGQFGLAAAEVAEGMLTVINAKMAQAIRTLTVEKGIEPRDFTLLGYGGAGPMHAAAIAVELGIDEVIIPPSPGAFSAWGMLQAPLRHDLTQMLHVEDEDLASSDLAAIYGSLEQRGRQLLLEEGARPESVSYQRVIGLRYIGQDHTIEVDLDGVDLQGEELLGEVAARFHAEHHRRYGHSTPDAPFESVVVRLSALGAVAEDVVRPAAPAAASVNGAAAASQPVRFDGVDHPTPVVERSALVVDEEQSGPMIVVEPTATTVVPPDFRVRVDASGALVLRRDN